MEVKLSPERRSTLLKSVKAAKRGDLTKAAKKFGVSCSFVTHLRADAGLKKLGAGRPKGLSKKMEARRILIVGMKNDGTSTVEIAKKFKISTQRVCQILAYK